MSLREMVCLERSRRVDETDLENRTLQDVSARRSVATGGLPDNREKSSAGTVLSGQTVGDEISSWSNGEVETDRCTRRLARPARDNDPYDVSRGLSER
jgi:hypothetical protein